MGKNFNKAKNRARRRAAALSIAAGVCFGAAVAGVLMLAFKLSAVELGWYVYLAAGVCAALIVCAIVFIATRPNDIKVAKMLDSDYELGEKAQTSVEFGHRDEAIFKLQRQDAEEAIGAIKYKRPSAKNVALSTVAVLACGALMVSGLAVTQRTVVVPTPNEDLPFEMTDAQLRLLNIMIDNIGSETTMDGDLQASHLESLNNLYDYLTGGTATNGGMVTEVQATMLEISAYTFETNTYDNFIEGFNSVDGGTPFAGALYNCATVYKSAANINDYETVKTKEKTLYDDIYEITADLAADVTEVTDATTFETNFETTMQNYQNILNSGSDGISADDALNRAVQTLIGEFLSCQNRFQNGGYTVTDLHNKLSAALGTFATGAATAMYAQTYNCMVDEYERQTLADIFGVAIQGLDNPEVSSGSGSSGDGSSGAGGAGSGETLYGSDDMIYDPSDGTYKSYGEMLSAETNSYLNRLYSVLNNDDISDEVKSYIQEYINKLLTSSGG